MNCFLMKDRRVATVATITSFLHSFSKHIPTWGGAKVGAFLCSGTPCGYCGELKFDLKFNTDLFVMKLFTSVSSGYLYETPLFQQCFCSPQCHSFVVRCRFDQGYWSNTVVLTVMFLFVFYSFIWRFQLSLSTLQYDAMYVYFCPFMLSMTQYCENHQCKILFNKTKYFDENQVI